VLRIGAEFQPHDERGIKPAESVGGHTSVQLRSISSADSPFVLDQTHPASEVVVVDDGSSDDTRSAIASIRSDADIPIHYVHQQNAGLSSARNTGIRESKHSHVAFLDADDLWEPTLLERVMERYAKLPKEYGLVATGSSRIDADGLTIPLPNRRWDKDGEFTTRDFCLRNRPLSSSVVIRREVFDGIGVFNTALRSSEDRDFWIRATAASFSFLVHQRTALPHTASPGEHEQIGAPNEGEFGFRAETGVEVRRSVAVRCAPVAARNRNPLSAGRHYALRGWLPAPRIRVSRNERAVLAVLLQSGRGIRAAALPRANTFPLPPAVAARPPRVNSLRVLHVVQSLEARRDGERCGEHREGIGWFGHR
jgi:hypothetical protein